MIYSQRHELPEPEMYVLTPEQADALARVDLGPKAQAMADRFGAVAVEGNVGVVVTEHEDGTNTAERYINLGEDLGTEILPNQSGSYEHFGLPALSQAVEKVDKREKVESHEAQREKRLAFITAPIPSMDERPRYRVASYDYLFMDDGPERDKVLADHAERAEREQKDMARYSIVTDASKERSGQKLAEAEAKDPEIRFILSRHQSDGRQNTVDLIRKSPELRYELGEYLAKKITNRIMEMPSRVVMNGGRTPNHPGYADKGNMSSREYAVLVALSMIDGTFQDPGIGDEVVRDDKGNVIFGQHRAAAEILLS